MLNPEPQHAHPHRGRPQTEPPIQHKQSSQIEFRSLSQQLSSQIADQYWDIITERFLKHSVNMQVLAGERMCVITEVERSCGLVLYAVEPQ